MTSKLNFNDDAKTGTTDNTILDNETHYCSVDLLKHLDDDNEFKKLCLSVANVCDLPASTVFLNGLGVFSSVSTRAWRVLYPDGDAKPLGLYVVTEQPSGAAKSRCQKFFLKPITDAKKSFIKDCKTKIKELSKVVTNDAEEKAAIKSQIDDIQDKMNAPLFSTDTTPEGLAATLHKTNGFFSAVSSEQGLFDSLLGVLYGKGGKNNNDIVLNAFDGGFVAQNRANSLRKCYTGDVAGNVVLFAQGGSIETVLTASNGSGLAERFLMLAERHNLGNRNRETEKFLDESTRIEYDNTSRKLALQVFESSKDFDELEELTITAEGWRMIRKFLQERVEPHLKDGGKYSLLSLRGAASKVDAQIMKIAGNLQLLQGVKPNFDTGRYEIDNDLVNDSIGIVADLLEAHYAMLKDKGLIGTKAEWQAIITFMTEKRPRGANMADLKNALRATRPFSAATGSKRAVIESAITEMVRDGLLTVDDGFYTVS